MLFHRWSLSMVSAIPLCIEWLVYTMFALLNSCLYHLLVLICKSVGCKNRFIIVPVAICAVLDTINNGSTVLAGKHPISDYLVLTCRPDPIPGTGTCDL